MIQGCRPLKQLSAFGSIISEATLQIWAKFKFCGHFDLSFNSIKKFWPSKAKKAKKGPVTFWGLMVLK